MNDEPQLPMIDEPPTYELLGSEALTAITMMGEILRTVPPLRHLHQQHHTSESSAPDGNP